jgi:hypothetical protein
MEDGIGGEGGAGMDAQSAAAILEETSERAKRALLVRRPVLFLNSGAAWIISYVALWLSVRTQRPFTGPTPMALLTVTIVIAVSVAVTVILVGRAGSGVGGSSAMQRRILMLALLGGYIAMFTLEAAIDHAGASRAVLSVYGAAAPVLLIGLFVAAGSAASADWSAFGLGIWLLIVATGSGFAGPVTVWMVDALAGGGALLLLSVFGLRWSRA